jgi:hypothetical protein
VRITLDGGTESGRRRIARLYRTARVVSHVTTDGHVVIEADVPRRHVAHWTKREETRQGVVDAS